MRGIMTPVVAALVATALAAPVQAQTQQQYAENLRSEAQANRQGSVEWQGLYNARALDATNAYDYTEAWYARVQGQMTQQERLDVMGCLTSAANLKYGMVWHRDIAEGFFEQGDLLMEDGQRCYDEGSSGYGASSFESACFKFADCSQNYANGVESAEGVCSWVGQANSVLCNYP